MYCITPGFPVFHHPPELAQTHVHWVGDAIQPSLPLSSPTTPAFNFSHQVLFQWVSSFLMSWIFASGGQSIGASTSASALTVNSFRTDKLDHLAVPGTLKSVLQHHSSKASVQGSAFLIIQLSHSYMTTGKMIALTRRTFVGKVMCLCYSFLPRIF